MPTGRDGARKPRAAIGGDWDIDGSEPPVGESLLHRVASGDTRAVEQCIDRFGGLIWSLARRLVPGPSEAEDAVQEVFIELWKNAGRFDPQIASENTFVSMIARRRLIDRRRKEARRLDSDSIPVEELPVPADPGEHRRVDLADDAAVAMRALGELRPEQRQVLELAVCQGWTHQVIADRLHMPLGTVKTHVRRGLLRVREMLEAEHAAEDKGGVS